MQGWAERIYATCPSAQVLYYNSCHYGPEFAVVLFGDRVPTGVLDDQSSRPVIDAYCHDAIYKLADDLSINYVDV